MIVIPDRLALRRSRLGDLTLLEEIDRDASEDHAAAHGVASASPEVRAAQRWSGRSSEQFVFFRLPDLDPIGYLSLYDTDHRNGVTWLTLRSARRHRHDGLALLGAGTCLTVVFRETALRRVYAETTDLHMPMFQSLVDDGTAEVEATFAGACLRPDGTTYDLHWLAVDRDRWARTWARLITPHLQERSEGSLVAASGAVPSPGRTDP